MNTEERGPESILDRAIHEIRNEAIDPAAASRAAQRVWARVSQESAAPAGEVEAIRSCADFQALIPARREGRLSPARALLLEDHIHECAVCRKALGGARQPVVLRPKRVFAPVWRWALAATVVLAAGWSIYSLAGRLVVPSGARATVYAAEGTLYRVTAGAESPLGSGAAIAERESVRTAKDSGAVLRLRDGSLVEMRERTEVAVSERRDGVTIQLAAGNIIVQAAKQHSRRLLVATDDCLVSVRGTIFSVNRGIRGSRVAVVEGEVQVTQGDQTKVLRPGEQLATSALLAPVPVEQEVAWSRNAGQYAGLLSEFAKFQKRLEAIPGPGLRYSTRLLDLAPQGAIFYAAIPNLGPTIGEAQRLFREQLAQSEVLRQWWAEKMGSAEGEARFNEVLARVQTFSAYLGPEVVVAFPVEASGRPGAPLLTAEVTRAGLREFLAQQIPSQGDVQIVDNAAQIQPGAHKAYIWVGPDLVAASNNGQLVQAAAAAAAQGRGPFVGSAFHARIAESYKGGVVWLFAADLGTMLARVHKPENALYERSGFADARYLLIERKDVAGRTENRAALTFSQPRRGVASWLAAPAPMRVLDFISPDAKLVTAAVVKNPAALVEDAFGMAAASRSDFLRGLAEFEAKTGVNVREDLARPLGGEFAFAVDGPALPMPAWKLVVEVYDPPRFQQAIERLVEAVNREAARGVGAPLLRLEREEAGGHTYYALRGAKLPFEANYVYEGGFLIAAPSRDLIARALELRSSGYTLGRSEKFLALLPRDGRTNFSAVVYQSLGTLLSTLAQNLTPEQRQTLEAAAAPSAVVAYGGPDRVEVASVGTFFGLRLEQLLSLGAAGGRHHVAPAGQHRPGHGS